MNRVQKAHFIIKHTKIDKNSFKDNDELLNDVMNHPSMSSLYKIARIIEKNELTDKVAILFASSVYNIKKKFSPYTTFRKENGFFVGFTDIETWGKFYKSLK